MRKKWIAVVIALNMAFLPAGCGSAQKEENTAAAQEAGGESAEADVADAEDDVGVQGAEEVTGNMTTIDYSSAVAAVISRAWNVEGEEETYVFSPDGSGQHGLRGEQEAFRYTCGFDEENNILVRIMTGESEETYRISSDETGYRLYMEAVEKNGERKLLTPAELEILDPGDERVSGILGIWKDDNGNQYELTDDSKFCILTSENSDGTFSVAEKEEGVREICILVAGGSLKYEYSLQNDGKTLELYSRDAESYHYWHREN